MLSILYVNFSIETNDKEDITPYFKEINTFIHYHRLQQRNVLVYSNAGLNRAPTIIAQYLIQVALDRYVN